MERTTNGSGTEKSGTTGRTLVCDNCGKTFTRKQALAKKMNFCCQDCCTQARRSGKFRPEIKNAPGHIPHKNVFVRITKEIDLFQEYRPEVGKTYMAEKYDSQKLPGYVVVVNGHRVCVRYGECEEVEHE